MNTWECAHTGRRISHRESMEMVKWKTSAPTKNLNLVIQITASQLTDWDVNDACSLCSPHYINNLLLFFFTDILTTMPSPNIWHQSHSDVMTNPKMETLTSSFPGTVQFRPWPPQCVLPMVPTLCFGVPVLDPQNFHILFYVIWY